MSLSKILDPKLLLMSGWLGISCFILQLYPLASCCHFPLPAPPVLPVFCHTSLVSAALFPVSLHMHLVLSLVQFVLQPLLLLLLSVHLFCFQPCLLCSSRSCPCSQCFFSLYFCLFLYFSFVLWDFFCVFVCYQPACLWVCCVWVLFSNPWQTQLKCLLCRHTVGSYHSEVVVWLIALALSTTATFPPDCAILCFIAAEWCLCYIHYLL